MAILMLGLISLSITRGQLIPNGTYEITPENSGLALAVSGVTDGTAIVQQAYTGAALQKWTVTNLGSNVIEMVADGTDEAMEVPGASTTAGTVLDISAYTGGSNQKWQVASEGSGFYELINVNSGLEINVNGGSTSPGANFCQWTVADVPQGVFAFTLISAPAGSNSTAFNLDTAASGANSAAFNDNTLAGAYDSFVLGRFNLGTYGSGGDTTWISTDPLLEVGNGTDSSHLSDAFIVYKNGNAVFQGSVQVAPSGDIPMYTGN